MLKDLIESVEAIHDLGAVSAETKGPGGAIVPDGLNELRNNTGIADD